MSLYPKTKWFYVIVVSLAAGAVANFILFFGTAFLFAGANGDTWVRWYFETGDGKLFLGVTFLLALPAIPYARKMNIVLK